MITVFRNSQPITNPGLIIVPKSFGEDGSYNIDDWCHLKVAPTGNPDLVTVILNDGQYDDLWIARALATHFDHMLPGGVGYRHIHGLYRNGNIVSVHLTNTLYHKAS